MPRWLNWLRGAPSAASATPAVFEIQFRFDPEQAHVTALPPDRAADAQCLMAAYVMFVARYFFICDERQETIVRDFLLSELRHDREQFGLAVRLHELVVGTLNAVERTAEKHTFDGSPPLGYTEGTSPRLNIATYQFRVGPVGPGVVASVFDMSRGPDTILLPAMVMAFYCFVIDKLSDEAGRDAFDQLVGDFLRHKTDWRGDPQRCIALDPSAFLSQRGLLAAIQGD